MVTPFRFCMMLLVGTVGMNAHEVCESSMVQSLVEISTAGSIVVSIPSRSTFEGTKPSDGTDPHVTCASRCFEVPGQGSWNVWMSESNVQELFPEQRPRSVIFALDSSQLLVALNVPPHVPVGNPKLTNEKPVITSFLGHLNVTMAFSG